MRFSLGLLRAGTRLTFNPADLGPGISIAEGNRRILHTNPTARAARSASAKSAGKWFFEAYVVSLAPTSADYLGAAKLAEILTDHLGTSILSFGYRRQGGFFQNGALLDATPSSFAAGDFVAIAVDLDNSIAWAGKNGSWFGDPATGTGGAAVTVGGSWYPAASLQGDSVNTASIRLVEPTTFSVPAGFSLWTD